MRRVRTAVQFCHSYTSQLSADSRRLQAILRRSTNPRDLLLPLQLATSPFDGNMSPTNDKHVGLLASIRHYPTAVYFMLGNEFCERFSFYGMRAILTLYLISEHAMSDSGAAFVYHAFVSLAYLSPMFGSIAADNYFGRFRVILWVSIVYVFGHVLLSTGAVPGLAYPLRTTLDFSGLTVIALATGGIKPCVSAFAADQFDSTQHDQTISRAQFFSFFYFTINAGSLLAILCTPMLRGRLSCFGSENCFALAFGVPGLLMLIALLIFLAGWKTYKRVPVARGNVVWKVVRCLLTAARCKLSAVVCNRTAPAPDHWLDYAPSSTYSKSFIAGVKSMVAVSILFAPVVLFWALYDQQGSTWILQARRMDGRVGALTILPDQMNIFNPLFILVMVPVFEGVIYPFVGGVLHIRLTPLRKMAVGGLLAALSFVIAGFVQLQVNKTLEPTPSFGNIYLTSVGIDASCHMHLINNNRSSNIPLFNGEKVELAADAAWQLSSDNCNITTSALNLSHAGNGYILAIFNTTQSPAIFSYEIEKTVNGRTRVYMLVDPTSMIDGQSISVRDSNGVVNGRIDTVHTAAYIDIQPKMISSRRYSIDYGCDDNDDGGGCQRLIEFDARMGAALMLHIADDDNDHRMYELVRGNSVNLLWQLPQFFTMTLGEVLFSVTGLEFSYTQADPSMRSVLQALWLMTVFLGNIIDMGISGSHMIPEPALEFFVYALLMLLVIGVFIFLAKDYVYVDEEVPTEHHQMDTDLSTKLETEN